MKEYAVLYDSNKGDNNAYSIIQRSDGWDHLRFNVYLTNLEAQQAEEIAEALNKE